MRQPTQEILRTLSERSVHPLQRGASSMGSAQRTKILSMSSGGFLTRPAIMGEVFGSQGFDIMARPTPPKSTNWAIWWSDLMMTMFIMFAALYAFQTPKITTVEVPVAAPKVPPTPAAPVSAAEESILARLYNHGRRAIEDRGLRGFAEIVLVPDKSVRFTLDGDQLFDMSAAQLKPLARTALLELGGVLREAPYKITVVGHAAPNDAPTKMYPTAWELSSARASALARFLIQEAGVPSRSMIVVGYADQVPLHPADSADAMSLNRRAEIVISSENPTDPLPGGVVTDQARAGFRNWMKGSAEARKE